MMDTAALRASRAHIACEGCETNAPAHFCARLTLADWIAGVGEQGGVGLVDTGVTWVSRAERAP